MKIKYILSGLLALAFYTGKTQVNSWQQSTTPPGGSILGLAVIGTNIFAGAPSGGVYYSPDNGTTWTAHNGTISPMPLRCIIANGTDLYVGTNSTASKIFKSSDLGLNWTDITPTNIAACDVRSLLITGNDIFASVGGCSNRAVVKASLSNIGPTSWATFTTGIPSGKDVRSLALSGNDILAGTYGAGVYKSSPSTANWTSSTGSGLSFIQTLCTNGSNAFAGAISGTPVMYGSSDSGTSWTSLASSTSMFNNAPVYAIISDGTNMYAGTEGEGVFISTDNGVTWAAFNQGFKNNSGNWYCNQINVRSFAFMGGYLYAGTDCGVWKIAVSSNVTGLDENSSEGKMQVFPNPSNEAVTISGYKTESSYCLNDISGKIVLQGKLETGKTKVDIAKLEPGIYFITAGNKSFKIVKE